MADDLTFTTKERDATLTYVEGNTDAGVDFVDSLLLEAMQVIDSGNIVILTADVEAIQRDAREQGLTMEPA